MQYFDDPNSQHFSFQTFASGLSADSFAVVSFKGYEAISTSYDFEILLLSANREIDLEEVLKSQAVLTIHRADGDDVDYNGILAEFDQLHEVNDVIFYRARLVPKFWWLTLTHHNQVFLNKSVPELVEDALRDGGLGSDDIDLSGLSGYEPLDYTCQYDETHFNFVSRHLERQGIYYYFNQQDENDVVVMTDSKFSHEALKQGADLFYNPASGLEGHHLGEAIGSFTCRQKQLPTEIILKDYNYERPSLDITSRAEVDAAGRGISYLYGEFFATPEEGERLANIRAEELLCKKQEFFGESTVPYIMPGFTFNLHNHYRDDFNQEYFIVEVTHEGNQSSMLTSSLAAAALSEGSQAIYQNNFKAIANDVQFRPKRVTEKPKISGTIHARIDSEVDSEYAQLDEMGRYRVKLPFDINDEHTDGKGSAPIRMMQPYAGKNRGMQFPLVKGTEVLLTFIEGNPDRPVIAGAVSNPETQGPVNANNMSESVIQTGGNNKIRMEDKAGSERMVIESPASNSWIRVGARNDPPVLNGSSGIYLEEGAEWEDPGAVAKVFNGTAPHDPFDYTYQTIYAAAADITLNGAVAAWSNSSAALGIWQFTYRSTNQYGVEETTSRTITVYPNADEWVDNPNDDNDGIRIRTAGNLWVESQSRFAEYVQGTPAIDSLPRKTTSPANQPSQLGDIRDNFVDGSYCPTGMLNYITGALQDSFQRDVLADAHVKFSSFDTVTTQEGNIYDFGGYWNYNLGNSYAEDHINQAAELNKKYSVQTEDDWSGFARNTSLSYIWTVISAGMGIGGTTIAGAAGKGAAVAAGVYGGAMGIAGLATSTISTVMDAVRLSGDADNIGDVIEGPMSGDKTIKTWAKKVGSSFNDDGTQNMKQKYDEYLGTSGNHFGKPKNYVDKPMTFDTTWVQKSFGDSYEFSKGNSIEISHGNKEEHVKGDVYEYKYGGAREATSFSGKGFKLHWERSANGNKHEAKWDSVTGQCVAFEYSKSGHFSFSLAMPTLPKLAINVSMASLDASLNLSAGTSINVSAAASLALNVSLTAGFSIDFERSVGGKLLNDETTNGFEFKAVGMAAKKEADMKLKKQNLNLIKTMTELVSGEMKMENGKMKVGKNGLYMDLSDFKFF